jgi:tRNA wybutosine-synthesizing protein 1
METTPSLACANKCVFCWRHHTNPVGKSWRWQMDDPIEIVTGALEQHTKMIKQMKGVPGNLAVFDHIMGCAWVYGYSVQLV